MSYLLTQMFLYMLVAFLLGLILGWLIWRYGQSSSADMDALRAERDALMKERDDLNTNLDACRARSTREREAAEALRAELEALRAGQAAAPAAAAAVAAPVAQSSGAGTRPKGLEGPRAGGADDLKEISGIGPKMENLVNSLGFYHFDQIAAWTSSELAWVDDNLEGFKGRVTRDNWIEQAKVLARR